MVVVVTCEDSTLYFGFGGLSMICKPAIMAWLQIWLIGLVVGSLLAGNSMAYMFIEFHVALNCFEVGAVKGTLLCGGIWVLEFCFA